MNDYISLIIMGFNMISIMLIALFVMFSFIPVLCLVGVPLLFVSTVYAWKGYANPTDL